MTAYILYSESCNTLNDTVVVSKTTSSKDVNTTSDMTDTISTSQPNDHILHFLWYYLKFFLIFSNCKRDTSTDHITMGLHKVLGKLAGDVADHCYFPNIFRCGGEYAGKMVPLGGRSCLGVGGVVAVVCFLMKTTN